jgi:hypothetical protein
MALPASGQISFNDVRIEMSQSAFASYDMHSFANGSGYVGSTSNYTPINVHSSNAGNYSTGSSDIAISDFYGYDLSLTYPTGSTRQDLFFNIEPSGLCFPSAMIVFNAGTTNRTLELEFSGSADDFTLVDTAVIYYGKPWKNDGSGIPTNASVIMTDSTLISGMNYSSSYSYVYNADSGSNIYFVIYGICP